MQRTPFAGLTALDENDPITTDGASFLIRNPRITDVLLRIGAKTHHHDAHAPLANPSAAMTGVVHASGGALPALQDYALSYTLMDSFGGETTPAPALALGTGSGLDAPSIAPTAVADYTGGILPAGAYYYGLTYTDGAGGETTLGPVTVVSVDPGYASGSVRLSDLGSELLASGGTAVTWRLWRSYEGADWHLLAEAATATFLDDGFDPPDNPARPPDSGGSLGSSALVVRVPSVGDEPAIADATAIKVYLAPDTNFTGPALYATLPVASAGATLTITADTVSSGAPPHVSTSIGGADKINPDTDLLDFPWKRPVVNVAALPSVGNTDGDMRETLDTHALYIWASGSSTWTETAGTGPAGGPGPTGPRGSLWYAGHGAPGAIGGERDQDFYLDVDSGDYYTLLTGTWTLEGTWPQPSVTTIPSSQETGDYTFVLADAGTVVESTGGTPATWTVPPDTFASGNVMEVHQYGAGQVTIAPGAGVTLRSDGGRTKTTTQYATIGLRFRGPNECVLSGDLA